MFDLARIQRELAAVGVDGWLVYDFKGLNPFARPAVGIAERTFLSRRWFCLVPREGEPRWLLHAIERAQFGEVQGRVTIFARRASLVEGLRAIVAEQRERLGRAPRLAMEYSPGANVPTISRVDAGTIELVRAAGADVVSSGDLVQALLARWPLRARELHDRAARVVEEAAFEAFDRIGHELRAGRTPTEVEIHRGIVGRMRSGGLHFGEGPIVAADAHAADPHYATGEGPHADAPIRPGSVVMLDLWGKLEDPDAAYADVTFMGFVGDDPPEKVRRVFEAVAAARDAALSHAQTAWRSGVPAMGFEVDRAARDVIERAGWGEFFTHRTGHSLGAEDHWIGANIDDFETREERRLIAGTGFTIEPGIYLPGEFGVRLEIDVFVGEGGPEATTRIQREIQRIAVR